jgi:hypothetical protein
MRRGMEKSGREYAQASELSQLRIFGTIFTLPNKDMLYIHPFLPH